MNNEELKKKIMEVIDNSVDDWATRDKRGRIHVHIEKIADALIAAGIGDVAKEKNLRESAESFYMKKCKECSSISKELRQSKRALHCLASSFAEAMCKDGDTQYLVDGFIKDAYKQAEKELAEERKDEN